MLVRCGLGLVWMVWLTGCNPQDVDRLNRVGRKVAEKAQTAPAANAASPQWPLLKVGLEHVGLEAKVRSRLQLDQALQGLTIEVKAQGSVIELRGKVRDFSQQKRAVDLARMTVGVSDVVDEIVISDR